MDRPDSNLVLEITGDIDPVASLELIIRHYFRTELEMSSQRFQTDAKMIANQESGHAESIEPHAGADAKVVTQYQSFELRVMSQDCDVIPNSAIEYFLQQIAAIPSCFPISESDGSTMDFKAWIANISLRRHPTQAVFLVKVCFEIEGNDLH